MGVIVVNPQGWDKLSKHSGNPFLDAMTDLQDVFSVISAYYTHKPYIDKYSDTSLSDLKDKVKAYLPEAINSDGSINFSKLEELAGKGNPLAEHILTIKQHRENFTKAPLVGQIEAIKNETLSDILSGNKLTKEANVLKKMQQFDEYLKNAKNIPEEWRTLLSLNKEAFLNDPRMLTLLFTILGNQQTTQNNSSQAPTSEADYIKSIIENNSSQSPTLDYINATAEDNTSSQTPTSEADYIKSIIENNLQKLPPQNRKQVIHKLKQIIETKKKQTQKTNKNNQSNIDINNPLKPLGDVSFQTQQQTPPIQPKTNATNNKTVLQIFKNATSNNSSSNPNMFKPIGNIIKHSTPPQPYIHPYIPTIFDDRFLGGILKRVFNSN